TILSPAHLSSSQMQPEPEGLSPVHRQIQSAAETPQDTHLPSIQFAVLALPLPWGDWWLRHQRCRTHLCRQPFRGRTADFFALPRAQSCNAYIGAVCAEIRTISLSDAMLHLASMIRHTTSSTSGSGRLLNTAVTVCSSSDESTCTRTPNRCAISSATLGSGVALNSMVLLIHPSREYTSGTATAGATSPCSARLISPPTTCTRCAPVESSTRPSTTTRSVRA